MSSAASLSRHPNRDPRSMRTPRISLRRRLRAITRHLIGFLREIIATPGVRHSREDFLEVAAREARERSEAIEASVGAMSAADIQRITPVPPADRPVR